MLNEKSISDTDAPDKYGPNGNGRDKSTDMSRFFPHLLDSFSELSFLERIKRKYHYGEGQMEDLKAVAEGMLPLMAGEAFWERKEWCAPLREKGSSGAKDKQWESVVISLGWKVDELQESYSREGMLSECYMLEVLAGEILLDSYGAYNRYIQENTDWHVARYHFLGSEKEFPLEMLPGILEDTVMQCADETMAEGKACKIICNSAFCIQPKKSVVFIAQLTKEEAVRCPGICLGCGSAHCPNRVKEDAVRERLAARLADLPPHYGYGRIFGNLV